MKRSAAVLAVLAPLLSSIAQAQAPDLAGRRLSPEEVRSVAPALERYTQEHLYGDVWNRAGLSRRDRSLVTLAVLIARNQTAPLTYYVGQALDNGVKPAERSELITHLAFYAGWENAFGAMGPAREVFVQRRIGLDQLPPASVPLLPLDQAAEADRAARVQEGVGPVSPSLVKDTADLLFKDLWLRPGLAPRDRSLVTVSALIAAGQVAQMPYHLGRAVDNGLTQTEASEAISHIAFYAGWPNAFSAVSVAKSVFERRQR
jgi:4-carboxymuconolactone decarboxylase